MICHVCGQALGESTNGLEAHMKRYHNVATLAPKRIHHTKAEVERIASRWEAEHPEFFVGLGKEHPEGCKCYPACFQKALDRLVSKTEAAANDSGTDSSVNNELASDELQERPRTDRLDPFQHIHRGTDEWCGLCRITG